MSAHVGTSGPPWRARAPRYAASPCEVTAPTLATAAALISPLVTATAGCVYLEPGDVVAQQPRPRGTGQKEVVMLATTPRMRASLAAVLSALIVGAIAPNAFADVPQLPCITPDRHGVILKSRPTICLTAGKLSRLKWQSWTDTKAVAIGNYRIAHSGQVFYDAPHVRITFTQAGVVEQRVTFTKTNPAILPPGQGEQILADSLVAPRSYDTVAHQTYETGPRQPAFTRISFSYKGRTTVLQWYRQVTITIQTYDNKVEQITQEYWRPYQPSPV
jgi:hypothetical protein